MHKTPAKDVFRTLNEYDRQTVGTYDNGKHSLTIFAVVAGVPTFGDWRKRREAIARRATMTQSTLGFWVKDDSKPQLETRPAFAVCYEKTTGRYLPALNAGTNVLQSQFVRSFAEATAAAAEATLHLERTGNHPTPADLDGTLVFIPGAEPGHDTPPEIADLLTRINDGGTTPRPAERESRPTSQTRSGTFSEPRHKQASIRGCYRVNAWGKTKI